MTADHLVPRLAESGAAPVDVGQSPDEDHVVLADPEGNELDLEAPPGADPAAVVDRLVRLGATVIGGTSPDHVVLADPDQNEVCLRR